MKAEADFVREQALKHARALGCDCNPDISYVKIGGDSGKGAMKLQIAHDNDCALMQEK